MCNIVYVITHHNVGTQEDVNLAVGAASKAFDSWSKLPGHVRARHLYSIARHVQKHARYAHSVVKGDLCGSSLRIVSDDKEYSAKHIYRN